MPGYLPSEGAVIEGHKVDEDESAPDDSAPQQQEQEPPKGQIEVAKINTNDPIILDYSVKYINKVPQGEVPVGGQFEIKYKYSISIPTKGRPEDAGRIEPVGKTGTFTDAYNLGLVSVKTKVNMQKESVVVEKTERYIVNTRTDIGSGNTAALNYRIAVTGPNAAGEPTTTRSAVSSWRQPLFGKGPPLPIEVRNVPLVRKRT